MIRLAAARHLAATAQRWGLLAMWALTVAACAATPDGPMGEPASAFRLPPDANVVLLGDSITAPGHYAQIMQNMIEKRYPNRGVRILARGANGDTARGAHRRVEQDVVAWNPAWVLINFGINDARSRYTPEQFLRHYADLIARIQRDTGGTNIAIVSPFAPDRPRPLPHMDDYVPGLKQLADKLGLLYIPLYERTLGLADAVPDHVDYGNDPLHPNAIGHHAIAQILLDELGFDFHRAIRDVDEPARRLNKQLSDAPSGTTFTLDLPQPVRFTLTDPPLGEVAAARRAEPIRIDGRLEEWTGPWPIKLGTPEQRVWGVVHAGSSHVTARVAAAWREDGLYLAFNVKDSFVRHAVDRPNVVSRDSLEVCLDLRPGAARETNPHVRLRPDTNHVYQYVLAPAGHEVKQATAERGNGDRDMLEGVAIASGKTPSGYAVEFFVPASHFPGHAIAPGTRVGFDCAVIDVDRQDNYLTATEFRWSGSPWSAYSTREFGEMTFIERQPDP